MLVQPDCDRCPLRSHKRQPVPPEGATQALLAVVGEGPGYNEEQKLRPFIGDSGKVLNWLLKRAGLRREDVWITNAALHRPRAISTTTQDGEEHYMPLKAVLESSVKNCRPRLLKELAIVKPRVIIATGNYALETLTGHSGILNRHGAVHEIPLQWMANTAYAGLDVHFGPASKRAGLSERTEAPTYVIPMVHPAYILRGESRHAHTCVRILQKAARIARQGRKPTGNFVLVSPYHPRGAAFALSQLRYWVEKLLADNADIAVDVETTSERAREAGLTVFGFGSAKHNVGVAVSIVAWNRATARFEECWTPAQRREVHELTAAIAHSKLKKWYWNYNFDVTVLERFYGPGAGWPVGDGMHLHWAMQPDMPHRLNYACQAYLDIPAWKTDFQERQRAGTATNDDLLIYNAQDCLYTAQVVPHLQLEVLQLKNDHVIDHQLRVTELARKAEAWGVPIDAAKWSHKYLEAWQKREDSTGAIRAAVAPRLAEFNDWLYEERTRDAQRRAVRTGNFKMPKRKDITLAEFNPQSPYHSQWLLYELVKLPIERYTPTGKPSRSYKGVLGHLKEPLVKAYVEFTEARHRMSMLEAVRQKCDPKTAHTTHPRLYVEWKTCGQKGTRWSSKLINLQNWEKSMRKVISNVPGRVWVGADAAQVEYRIAACLAGLDSIIDLMNKPPFDEKAERWKKYHPDWDPHSLIAVRVFGDGYMKLDLDARDSIRVLVKRVVYALFYGARPPKILSALLEDRRLRPEFRATLTLQRIEKIWLGFRELFPNWDHWGEAEQARAADPRIGYQTFPPLWRRRYWPVPEIELNKILNTPIQLAAGDVVNILFCRMDDRIVAEGLDSVMSIHGHDACYWDTLEAHAERVKQIVNEEFEMNLSPGPGRKSVRIYGQADIGPTIADV